MQEAKSSEEWIKEVSGYGTVHPGHPLVIACSIIRTYRSHQACIEKDSEGHCEAIADSRVPGTGQHVRDALKMLGMGSEGASIDDMVSFSHVQWVVGQAGGHSQKVLPGQEQALLLEPWFRVNVGKWLGQNHAAVEEK